MFNKVQDKSSEELLYKSAAEMGVDVLGVIPQDENIVKYDLIGRSLSELPNNTPTLAAVDANYNNYICL